MGVVDTPPIWNKTIPTYLQNLRLAMKTITQSIEVDPYIVDSKLDGSGLHNNLVLLEPDSCGSESGYRKSSLNFVYRPCWPI